MATVRRCAWDQGHTAGEEGQSCATYGGESVLEEILRPQLIWRKPFTHWNCTHAITVTSCEVVAPIHTICSRLTCPRKVGGMSQELLSGEPLPSQELTAF